MIALFANCGSTLCTCDPTFVVVSSVVTAVIGWFAHRKFTPTQPATPTPDNPTPEQPKGNWLVRLLAGIAAAVQSQMPKKETPPVTPSTPADSANPVNRIGFSIPTKPSPNSENK